MLNVARKSMMLYFMRNTKSSDTKDGSPVQIVEVDLAKLFTDSEADKIQAVHLMAGLW